nr:TPA_asm: coat protein [Allium ophiovirus]
MAGITQYLSIKDLVSIIEKYENNNNNGSNEELTILKKFESLGNELTAIQNRTRTKAKFASLPNGWVKIQSKVIHYLTETAYLMESGKEKPSASVVVDPMTKDAPEHQSLGAEKVKTITEFKSSINRDSYSIDSKAIESHLLKFLESVTVEDEGYLTGELKVYFYEEETSEVMNLIGAGTKVLDALLYASMGKIPSAKGMFSLIKVTELTQLSVGKYVQEAKRAIQAAAILVYIQGSLPKQTDDKMVPKFISDKIYKGEIANLGVIGKQLSSANTEKFPSKIFLNIDINKFPVPVATRAKLSIAGNKGIRYAVFAGTCEKNKEIEINDTMKGKDIAIIQEWNTKIKLAVSISDFLRSLNGNVQAQLKMHPLAPNRPVVKSLLLKITRAIIESLNENGRIELYSKMVTAKNNSFLNDSNFSGEEVDGSRVWRIMENSEADFADISVASLKNVYGIV